MELTGWLTPDEFWEQFDAAESRVRASAGELPCYGVRGWSGPVALGEWDFGSHPPVTVSLVHGPAAGGARVQVWTTSQDARRTVDLYRMMADGPPKDQGDLVQRQHVLDAALSYELQIRIDGVPVPFSVWPDADHWWAAGVCSGYGVIIEGFGIRPETVALEGVHDVEPYLNGRRAQLRAVRGET
jgi:hypothetical protein